ncbi:hypothetical protein NA78x_002063 [Anatilimnocola sp. NA78]|uniref:hypothetical protein n=1 Tax=Anatilimnocola sp. NA78 TaxID=3415683 RepID=UPI003CE56256
MTPDRARLVRRLLIAVGGFVGILIVTGAVAWGYLFYSRASAYWQLVNGLNVIREKGEPLGGEKLDEFYRIPEGEADFTESVVTALTPFSDEMLGSDAKRLRELTLAKNLKLPVRSADWPDFVEAQERCRKYRGELDELRSVLDTPGSARFSLDYSRGLVEGVRFEHLTPIVSAHRLLILQSLCNFYQGNTDLAIDDVVKLMQLAELVRHEPFSISQLIRKIIWDAANSLVAFFAHNDQLSFESISKVRHIASNATFDNAYYLSSIGERAITFESLKLNFGNLDWEEPRSPEADELPTYKLDPVSSATTMRYFTMHVEASKLPWDVAVDEVELVRTQIEREMAANEKIWPEMTRDYVTPYLYAPLHRTFQMSLQAEAERRAILVVCAIEWYQHRNNKLPTRLSDLVPEYIASIPADPVDKQPLRYATDKNGYAVYSIGLNRSDDQGRVGRDSTGQCPDFGLSLPLPANAPLEAAASIPE